MAIINERNQLEYIGRIDRQVKINGFRIELGEIENQCSKLDFIKSCIVILDHKSNLVLFYISEDNIDQAQIKDHLSKTLPSYMLPKRYKRIDSIPMMNSGKINENKLRNVLDQDCSKEDLYNLGVFETIWSDVLNLDKSKVSLTDRLFDVGGDSLTLLELQCMIANRMRDKSKEEILINKLIEMGGDLTLEKAIEIANECGGIEHG